MKYTKLLKGLLLAGVISAFVPSAYAADLPKFLPNLQ